MPTMTKKTENLGKARKHLRSASIDQKSPYGVKTQVLMFIIFFLFVALSSYGKCYAMTFTLFEYQGYITDVTSSNMAFSVGDKFVGRASIGGFAEVPQGFTDRTIHYLGGFRTGKEVLYEGNPDFYPGNTVQINEGSMSYWDETTKGRATLIDNSTTAPTGEDVLLVESFFSNLYIPIPGEGPLFYPNTRMAVFLRNRNGDGFLNSIYGGAPSFEEIERFDVNSLLIFFTDYYGKEIGILGRIDSLAPVPEPTTILLFGTGLAALAAVGRRRRK